MTPHRITYLVAACLLLIFATQAYLVLDHFRNTRASLSRETNAILEDAFRRDLNERHKLYKQLVGESNIVNPPPKMSQNTVKFDCTKRTDYADNVLGLLDLAINTQISKLVPLHLSTLDSVTGSILKSRNIRSEFLINIVDPTTGKVLKHSDKAIQSNILLVPSKILEIDLDKQKSLQLVLINPFGLIIKRMGLMLISSFILSILCLLGFRFLLRILARQKQLVTFKNEFLTTIAHELKRPVASLSFNLDCLSIPAFIDNTTQRELLVSKSINATSELNDTINMIVALAKLEEGILILNKEPINLKKLFDELKQRFKSYSAKGVEIQMICECDDISVTGDVRLLNQCFANLIDNAIKYSNNDVLIIISLRKEGHWIIISVKDNGYGISEEKLPVIFDKYTRLNPENTTINGFGIGLNYVKTIVEKHQGEVEVISHPGEGSEFSVLLPA
ncbi:MAG TPA: HAMP domain-containing sensor histidine kinase [Paludibacter sp.]